ncbi:hypothetical protein [Oryza sativa Japonica Group]|uniref:Uncharacterized protein n=1 Tax=Oryza sativa subsp. japonica TaxID=39947 RepID=Q5VQR5_ORYSJ|nr:hypothetical protein [Oryza sativa Japonica Group]
MPRGPPPRGVRPEVGWWPLHPQRLVGGGCPPDATWPSPEGSQARGRTAATSSQRLDGGGCPPMPRGPPPRGVGPEVGRRPLPGRD